MNDTMLVAHLGNGRSIAVLYQDDVCSYRYLTEIELANDTVHSLGLFNWLSTDVYKGVDDYDLNQKSLVHYISVDGYMIDISHLIE